MGREAHSSNLGQGNIRDAGIALEYMARSEEKTDPSRWCIVMEIIKTKFDIGELALY